MSNEWKNASEFEKCPLVRIKDEVGQETIGKFLGTRHYTDKDGQVQVVHAIEQNGVKHEFFGSGLLNWLLDPKNNKVSIGQEIKVVYKGLEDAAKKAGKGNRHQFELYTK